MSQKRDGLCLEKEQSLLTLGTSSNPVKSAELHSLVVFALLLQISLGPLAQCHLQPSHFQLRLFVCPEPPRTCVHKAYSPALVDPGRWGERQNGATIQSVPCILAVLRK